MMGKCGFDINWVGRKMVVGKSNNVIFRNFGLGFEYFEGDLVGKCWIFVGKSCLRMV